LRQAARATPSSSASVKSGSTIETAFYAIVSPLGAGGMGEVYRSKDLRLGREVAIKILPAAFTEDGERVARFQREAQVLGACCRTELIPMLTPATRLGS
jgi:serine/threonine protein kinase